MYTQHLASFHFDTNKLSAEWCNKAIQALYYRQDRSSLLEGKDVDEIEQYSTGNIDMRPFKRMYKSMAKESAEVNKNANPGYNLGNAEKQMLFNPLPLISSKLNSAIATMQKVPFEVTVKALDALAVKKKKDDINFLKNKPGIEAELQPIADMMGVGQVDLGTTKYSSVPYSSSPYGLDLNEPDELKVFVDLLYSLSVESSFESVLQIFYELKNIIQLRLLEVRNQLKYGVSCHGVFQSDITGLPDVRYIYPGSIEVPSCDYPDYSDRSHEFEYLNPTVMELFNMMGGEIRNQNDLEVIMNGKYGYCEKNKIKGGIDQKSWNTFKTNLIYCKVKSVDWVGVRNVATSTGETEYEFTLDEKEASEKIWAQNTYSFYWLKNTKYFFKIDKLDYAYREKGQEQYQGFDTNIYKSQDKSPVEQAIGENKKAQIASIKMEHAIIKSLPAGKVIDLKGLRSALTGALKDEANEYTMSKLISMALEENIILIDTEGWDNPNEGQLKPFYEIPGGVKSEISGYADVIAIADSKISQLTGINEQLTGTSANPEGLIGMQKLLINSSINSLHPIQEATTSQYQKLMNIWAFIIKRAVEEGGDLKEAIVNFIGKEKADIIDGLSQLPLHNMGVKITLTQREEERAKFEMKKQKLADLGVLNSTDEYMLDAIQNPKDKVAFLAVKEKQFLKRKEQKDQQVFAQQQQLAQQGAENQMQINAAAAEKEKELIYAKGEVQGKIISLAETLGLTKLQMEGLTKRALQRERGIDQERKGVSIIKAKQDAEQQKSIV